MRVLVTDSDNRSALAATRSLGRAGYEVLVMGEREASIAAASRYCSRFLPCPSPIDSPDRFLAAVLAACGEHRVQLLLPMTEVTTLLLTRARAQLPAGCVLPFADEATLQRASDKAAMVALAESLGVPTPLSVRINSPAELDDVDVLPYPVVVKPGRSRVLTEKGWLSTGVTYANNATELRTTLDALPSQVYPVLLQERIEGPGEGFFALYAQGKPVAFFAHRRLREKPPSGGVSVLRESAEIAADTQAYGTALLDALHWHGVAMVEFKRCENSRRLFLMEINARFWGSLQLAIDSGVDFPLLLARIAAGETPAPVKHRIGVRSRWLLGDLDVLIKVLTKPRESLNLPANFPSRGRLVWEFMQFWRKDERDEIWQRDDRKPGWFELKKWLAGR
jgi:predicted ATP-grasp superfamily ATP-dependent carboligase